MDSSVAPAAPPAHTAGQSCETAYALHASGVSLVRNGRPILDRVDLLCREGSVTGLLGPNGAGKTSLLRVSTGMLTPTSGEVLALGEPVRAQRMPAGVGALIEEPRFYPWLTARENLRVVATGRPDRLAQIADVLEAAGLGERADEKVKRFSQGMRQRLGIARALLGSPSLVILDEPTNGLDPAGFRWIRSLIGDLRERAVTVVIASHVLSEVQIMCTDVAILADGKGVVAGPTDAVLSGKHSLEDVFFAATEET